jgi:protein-L-isoaspartate(D-aspartate) O-methyltransferase
MSILLLKVIGAIIIVLNTVIMAWRFSGSSQHELVEILINAGIIRKEKVVKALKEVDRKHYCPRDPYVDSPQYIGYGATISAPSIHAAAMEHLYDYINRDNSKILDVGCGSGYLSVVMSRFNPSAKVYGIDCIPQLVDLANNNVKQYDNHLLKTKRLQFKIGDGWNGFESDGPFDAIHVGAAANKIPLSLINQLKVNGRMLVPIGGEGEMQKLMLVDKIKDGVTEDCVRIQRLMNVYYVPLVKKTD